MIFAAAPSQNEVLERLANDPGILWNRINAFHMDEYCGLDAGGFRRHTHGKTVKLDEICRQQQVHDGCFAALTEVPTHAVTLTIPALCNAKYMFCVVPASTKADAVKNTCTGPICEACPASVLRRHPGAVLYLDSDSSAYL